jgi:hypothetical protein
MYCVSVQGAGQAAPFDRPDRRRCCQVTRATGTPRTSDRPGRRTVLCVRPGRRTGRDIRPARPAEMVLSSRGYRNCPDKSPDRPCSDLVWPAWPCVALPACPSHVSGLSGLSKNKHISFAGLSGCTYRPVRLNVYT